MTTTSSAYSIAAGWRRGPRRVLRLVLAGPFLTLMGCSGRQSILDPAGSDASQLLQLFWVMLTGAVIIWLAVIGLYLFVTQLRTGPMPRPAAETVIIGGGILLPLVVLIALVSYGLNIMPEQRAPGDGLKVRVIGERWWWRVEYLPPGAETPIVSANELRLPVGQRTEIELEAAKVIHAFWVPALGGKTDMIPGQLNRMSLEPTRVGTFRGQCTEFCGLSHALMAFEAVVMPEQEFAGWLARQAEPAAAAGVADPGRELFFAEGCGACHTVMGTAAVGAVGPDLSHVGSRVSLAAAALPMNREALVRWIRDAKAVKPGAEMPAYDHLSESELQALAGWLESLQ